MKSSTVAQRLIAVTCLVLVAFPTIAFAGFADDPPPVPTLEKRMQLIAAERDAWEMAQLPAADSRAIHDEYDVGHYDIDMSLDIPAHVITGSVTLQLTAQAANLSQINLDLYQCMTVDGVTVNGNPAVYSRLGALLTVTLDRVYQPDETFTVTGAYHGTPSYSLNPFRWSMQNGAPMILSYSEPYGAPAWWLCKDDPKDKATFTLQLTVPDTLCAVSNGSLTGVVDHGDGTATYTWNTDYPMSPYLFSIAVTNYYMWTEPYTALDGVTTMDVRYYAYPADSTRARVSWSNNIQMMEYYASIFGEYPFLDEKYGIAEFAHPGAMEHQTCTSMGAVWVTGTNVNDDVVAHELSHAWVGDMIGITTWSHAWCKEGFATYCEALYFESLYGEHYYHQYMASIPGLAYGQYRIFNMNPPLHAAIYYKGGWVFHMLRHVVGDAAFFDAIYAYTNDPAFRYRDADTEDLRGVFETVSGMDLTWFFDEWVYSPGYPIYDFSWWPEETREGCDVNVRIIQRQHTGPVFKMPIDLRVVTDLGEETFVLWDSLATQSFTLHVDAQPTQVDLDPGIWILREFSNLSGVESDPRGIALVVGNGPNPFTRTTWIDFSLAAARPVQLDVYDIGGRWIRRLADGPAPAGASRVRWDGADGSGRPVGAGTYFYRLQAGDESRGGRMLLVR
jgi:aminopeptidase N